MAALAAGCGGGGASVGPPPRVPTPTPTAPALLRISSDPFSNASSQHATEVEPDVASSGAVVVSTFQAGRFFSAGASGIGFSTSLDGGHTWRDGILPDITRVQSPRNPYDAASDPTVAYDAAHHVWLIASLPIVLGRGVTPGALISRSLDGLSWSSPVPVGPGQKSADKSWIACDDSAASPFFGRCYVEWDDPSASGLVLVSTSLDGGATWGAPLATADRATGIGGHPVVEPSGLVVIPMNDYNQASVRAFVSSNGGASWSATVMVSNVADHLVAGSLRTSPLPSAAVDQSGTVYVVWQDCRFRAACASNDLVLSRSVDGVHWTSPARIPIDPATSTMDHFIPGLSANLGTGGGRASLALAYYFYPVANCTSASCALDVGFVQSPDGGSSWTAPILLAGPMTLGELPATRDGLMVGDYIATTFSASVPIATFAVALPAQGLPFNEAMYVPKRTLVARNAGPLRRAGLERPIPGAVSDHAPRRPRPRTED